MVERQRSDPTLVRLRAALAAGDMQGIRDGLMSLSADGRRELAERLGAHAVERLLQTTRRARRGTNGRVVLIHGIMGGKLAIEDKSGDDDLVWVNYLRLIAGRIGDLRLDADGNQADPNLRVITRGLLDEYLSMVAELDSKWNVLPFAFDWRQDIDRSAHELNEAINKWSGGEPAHIVAHSMGGLVSRRLIQLHPQTWRAMADGDGLKRGGRLIMLGTPNRGSFAIPFVLTGEEKTVRILERFDLAHNMPELLAIIDTFVGSYQMLPSPRLQFGDDRLKLYTEKTWGPFPVAQPNLDRGRGFQEGLDVVTDADRLVYVAGYDQATPFRIRVDAPGDFSYQETQDGDGRVSHELGLLPGVRTFFVREKHGNLPSNDRVLAGIHDLLQAGTTSSLDPQVPASRGGARSLVWRKAREIAPVPPAISALVGAGVARRSPASLSPSQQIVVETELMEPYLGSLRGPPGVGEPPAEPKPSVKGRAKASLKPRLQLEVMWGDIRYAEGDVYAAGHYQGVLPQNGERALDLVVSGKSNAEAKDGEGLVITSLTRRGMIRGALGDVNFFPWADKRQRRTVAIAGMGHAGTFFRPELRRLARSLTESVTALPGVETVNMLLIGSGAGNLQIPDALEALLQGMSDALGDVSPKNAIRKVRIVERDRSQAQMIYDALRALVASPSKGPIDLKVRAGVTAGRDGRISDDLALTVLLAALANDHQRGRVAARRDAARFISRAIPDDFDLRARCEDALKVLAAPDVRDILAVASRLKFRRQQSDASSARIPTRVSFIQDEGGVRAAALTQSAVVPERFVGFDWSLVEKLIENMTDPSDVSKIPGMASLLARFVVPRDFREYFAGSEATIFEVDRTTARIHWEMLGVVDDGTMAGSSIGLIGPVARQLRTSYSPPPSRAAQPGPGLRALVIGDPGDPKRGLGLPGARREAIEVARLLQRRGVEVVALIGAPGGDRDEELAEFAPASLLDVLMLLNDDRPFDLLHYAGHGDFDPKSPETRAGWLFSEGMLTSREIERVDTVPALIVANACLSGLTSDAFAGAGDRRLRSRDDFLLPGLADEFFKRGVRNYVGTAWEVNDVGAITFSTVLYEAMLPEPGSALAGATLGDALLKARTVLKGNEATFGALWAAYQHYGDPDFSLTARLGSTIAAPAASVRSKKRSIK